MSRLSLLEQLFQFFSRLCRAIKGFRGRNCGYFKTVTKIAELFVLHEFGLRLAALMVGMHVIETAIAAAMQIRGALGARVFAARPAVQINLGVARVAVHLRLLRILSVQTFQFDDGTI